MLRVPELESRTVLYCEYVLQFVLLSLFSMVIKPFLTDLDKGKTNTRAICSENGKLSVCFFRINYL